MTYDDMIYNFYKNRYPLLKSYCISVTVFHSTYYTDYSRPIFNLICSYMLWKRRGSIVDAGKELGLDSPLDLTTSHSRFLVERQLVHNSLRDELDGKKKDRIAPGLTKLFKRDYTE